jgi:hypothetical protein
VASGQQLHYVREIGNFAAHPSKDNKTGEIIDVEPGEAEFSLNVIEDLFDFYFVAPERLKQRRAAINPRGETAVAVRAFAALAFLRTFCAVVGPDYGTIKVVKVGLGTRPLQLPPPSVTVNKAVFAGRFTSKHVSWR